MAPRPFNHFTRTTEASSSHEQIISTPGAPKTRTQPTFVPIASRPKTGSKSSAVGWVGNPWVTPQVKSYAFLRFFLLGHISKSNFTVKFQDRISISFYGYSRKYYLSLFQTISNVRMTVPEKSEHFRKMIFFWFLLFFFWSYQTQFRFISI